ncbi:MAG: hypothetical protein ABI480_12355 [Chitinophagaceae bacterium]
MSNKLYGGKRIMFFYIDKRQDAGLFILKTKHMQTSNKKMIISSMIIALSALFFSFTKLPGGDSFEIYLNKKMVMQQYVAQMTGPKQLVLSQSNANDQLDIYYSHCGQIGTDRTITIKDAQNKVIKTWHFPNASASNKAMSVKAKELLDLQKSGTNLQLFYSSHELPEGRLLATVAKESGVRRV